MNLRILILFIFATIFASGLRAEFRTWTSNAGTTVEAELVEKTETHVRLKLKNGKVISVPINQLKLEGIPGKETAGIEYNNLRVTEIVDGRPDWINNKVYEEYDRSSEYYKNLTTNEVPDYNSEKNYKNWETSKGETITGYKLYQKWPNHVVLENKTGERKTLKNSELSKESTEEVKNSYLPEMIEPKNDEVEIAIIDSTIFLPTKEYNTYTDEENKIRVTSSTDRLKSKNNVIYAGGYLWITIFSERKIVGINYYGPPELWKHANKLKYGRYGTKTETEPKLNQYKTSIEFNAIKNWETGKEVRTPMWGEKPLLLPKSFYFTIVVKGEQK